MVDPLISKLVSYKSKQEKKGNYSFCANDTSIKCWLDEMEAEKAVKVGISEAIEVVDSMFKL